MADLLVENLTVQMDTPQGKLTALEDISFHLKTGDTFGLLGETGAGKTTLARALLGLHPPHFVSGKITFDGLALLSLSESQWQPMRWKRIALGVQNASTAFDPVYTIQDQISETMRSHNAANGKTAVDLNALAQRCGLQPRHLRSFPHQLSGGEKQRAMLAMALSCRPELLVLDEPTGAQDMLSRKDLVDLIGTLQSEWGFSLIVISHDLAAISQLTRQAAVLYAGRIIESGPAGALLSQPRHPYTWGLMNAYPRMDSSRDLSGIRGQLPDPLHPPPGCRFHPRCTQASDLCRAVLPRLQETGEGRQIACHLGGLRPLIAAEKLCKQYPVPGNHASFTVLKEVSLIVYEGEIVAVVGQTGSGKTTLARLLGGLLEMDNGAIWLQTEKLNAHNRSRWQSSIQYIPQDPFDAVSPRLNVGEIVREPLEIQNKLTTAAQEQIVRQSLGAVNLPQDEAFMQRYSHQLSGGQLQRVCIARALTVQPRLIIADEPVAMLDPSEQARLIRLIKDIQNERGLGVLLVSHDLALVRKAADRILVLHGGRIIEEGPAGRLIASPQTSFTRQLLDAAPRIVETNLDEKGEWKNETHSENSGLKPAAGVAAAGGLQPDATSNQRPE